jgi:hypothetical protein
MLVKDAASFALRLEAHKHRQLAEGLCAGDAAGAARILRKTAAHSERPAPAIVHSRPQPAHLAVHSKDIHHDIP